MTAHLLAFSRKESVNRKVINLNQFMKQSIQMYAMMAGDEVSIQWHPGDQLPAIYLDPVQLDQILSNLIANSRDAMAGRGTITITAQKVDSKQIPELFGGLNLEVTDEGCGMDDETLQKIFEPFFTTKELDRGTGLGLPAVYNIVTGNGGTIRVDSAPGSGTKVTITLPEAAGDQPSDTYESGDAAESISILLVDDEDAFREMTESMLNSMGFSVSSASSGEQALDTLTKQVDLLLTDIAMQGMDGFSLARICKDRRLAKHILCMTGYTAHIPPEKEHQYPIIRKPFTRMELKKSISKLMSVT
jgi:CheY-like chemotaxis protein